MGGGDGVIRGMNVPSHAACPRETFSLTESLEFEALVVNTWASDGRFNEARSGEWVKGRWIPGRVIVRSPEGSEST